MASFDSVSMCCWCFLVFFLEFQGLLGQQSYVNNKQLDCENNDPTTLGFVCNGVATSCPSYLTFRTNPTFNNPAKVANLLAADASEIARINNISATNTIPVETLLVVPVNCSCSNRFYQHNASYVRENHSETYFSVANNTYQALTTCQSMIAQNPYNYRNLSVGTRLSIPVRCACPTANQTAAGFKYLLTYPVRQGDTYESIAKTFNVDDTNSSIQTANELSDAQFFFFFTPLLVPLKSEPININTSSTSPPPPPPPPPHAHAPSEDNESSTKWVFVGVGIGVGLLLLLSGVLVWYFRCCCRVRSSKNQNQKAGESTVYAAAKTDTESNSWSETVNLGDAIGSLTVYKFDEITKATNFFGEANRIEGSVYKASFKGDNAAVKVMKGDVSSEINVLKQINHSNIIRLSGFCVHQGNTYLVYEYAENGSLRDWLHRDNKKNYSSSSTTMLGWKQRIQIAYDAADALNYLHNYANPPYIHKNLKSSNVLLDANMRAKIVNFGLARELDNEGGLVMTRHVVGTHGYMAPEYIENGLVTPKLDVFALGVVMLELLSGKEADGKEREMMLSEKVGEILGGENVREKLRSFMDPYLGKEYPLDSAYAIAQLANNCVSRDLNSRPTIAEVFFTLSKILSSSLDWDSSYELENSGSVGEGR